MVGLKEIVSLCGLKCLSSERDLELFNEVSTDVIHEGVVCMTSDFHVKEKFNASRYDYHIIREFGNVYGNVLTGIR